jgi:ankyrin repeat protein
MFFSLPQGGMTALLYAASMKDRPDLVSLLIENGASVDVVSRGAVSIHNRQLFTCSIRDFVYSFRLYSFVLSSVKRGMAPIHHAAKKGCQEVVSLLLDRGADVNLKSEVSFIYMFASMF